MSHAPNPYRPSRCPVGDITKGPILLIAIIGMWVGAIRFLQWIQL